MTWWNQAETRLVELAADSIVTGATSYKNAVRYLCTQLNRSESSIRGKLGSILRIKRGSYSTRCECCYGWVTIKTRVEGGTNYGTAEHPLCCECAG